MLLIRLISIPLHVYLHLLLVYDLKKFKFDSFGICFIGKS